MFENKNVLNFIANAEKEIDQILRQHDATALFNQNKVLSAMQHNRLAERHFASSTGYGYNDDGRELTEKVFAEIFGAEKALVRPSIVSGTHAISLVLYGVLRPGDNFMAITGRPYDTIYSNIGTDGKYNGLGTLQDFGIGYKEVDLKEDNSVDYEKIKELMDDNTKLIYIQRSTGYSLRDALTVEKIGEICSFIRTLDDDVIIFTDNCYGEFIEEKEPCEVGVDIIAGSLIKNPGGGLAQTGGYICGKEKYIDMIASRLTAPSIAYEVGATLGVTRSYLQGVFIAPSVVNNAIKGAILTSYLFEKLGFEVFPKFNSSRSDIIQAIVFKEKEKVISYCRTIQAASPVDSYVTPEPWDMPGYDDPVIMAAGNFIQGSSIELSADSPMRPPFVVYQQGGLTYEHVKIALYNAISELNLLK